MEKYQLINENISKTDWNLYTNMKTISEFVIKYRYYLNIDEKIIREIYQVLNSINIILTWVLKAQTKLKELNQHNIKSKNQSDKCLLSLECAKVEIVKKSILDFDKIAAKKIIWCTDWTIRDIENLTPKIVQLIEELQISFVEAISWEKKQEKIKKVENPNQAPKKIEEIISEVNPVKIEETKIEELVVEDPNEYYRNFNSGNLDTIKDFYNLCEENQKANYFLKFLKNNFKWLSVLTKLKLIDFLIYKNFDAKYIKDNLLNADLRASLNSRILEQWELYAKLSNKLNSILNPKKANLSETKFQWAKENPEITPKAKTSNWLIRLSSQWVFSEEEKLELINTPQENLEEIKEVPLKQEYIKEEEEEEKIKIQIEPNIEETVIKPIIKEKTHIRIVKKREEKAETIPEIPWISKDEVITFIGLLGTNKKENNEFISKNKFDLKSFEKSEIFKVVRNKINILCDELDYTRLYYLLELAEKLDLFLNLEWLRKKFLNLALKLSKTEKNNKIFKLFLDKYIINN